MKKTDRITESQAAHVAHLAGLALTDAQVQTHRDHLERILEHVERIREVNLDGVAPLAHALEQAAVPDEDVAGKTLPREAALALSSAALPPYFSASKVVGEDGPA